MSAPYEVMCKRLKNCPCCGSPGFLGNYVIESKAFCKKCKLQITKKHSAKSDTGIAAVIKAWNKRV